MREEKSRVVGGDGGSEVVLERVINVGWWSQRSRWHHACLNNSDTPIMQLERRDSDVLELIWRRCRDISVRRS